MQMLSSQTKMDAIPIGRLDIELLEGFVAIVEHGSMKHAAERLSLTPSAISMQLRRLEERVGRQLLARGGGQIVPTEDGHMMLRYARPIVELMEEARYKFSTPALSGVIRVGLPEWLASSRVQKIFARFARSHPDVQLTVRTDPSWILKDALDTGELDMALAIIDPAEHRKKDVVYQEPLVWVVGEGCPLNVGEEMPLALFDPPCVFRAIILERLGQCGWVGQEVFTSQSVAAIQSAVKSGFGMSVLPESAVIEGLRVLGAGEGFPALPNTELAIYQGNAEITDLKKHLHSYIEECLTCNNK